jgi:hypothetical protein
MAGLKTISQKIGLLLCIIGAAYMIVVGWLSSWWMVPAIREVGIARYPDQQLFLWWGISTPVGALFVIIGAALMAQISRRRIVYIICGGAALTLWISIMSVSSIIPVVFGIGGGLIMLFFLITVVHWIRYRQGLSDIEKSGADLHVVGQMFLIIAAWYLCGLLGAPIYLLRPELTSGGSISLATTILVCLVLGWGFTFFGNRLFMRKSRK